MRALLERLRRLVRRRAPVDPELERIRARADELGAGDGALVGTCRYCDDVFVVEPEGVSVCACGRTRVLPLPKEALA